MTSTPIVPRRHFLARVLGAIAGGAWLSGLAPKADAAPLGDEIPYLGEIRMFAGNFAPVGWFTCDGRLLSIEQYDPLFRVIGTTYGGDGQYEFALPDLRGRIPLHPNSVPLGGFVGEETVTLLTSQIPLHSHNLQGNPAPGSFDDPTGHVPARNALGSPHYASTVDTAFATDALIPSGQFQPHDNLMPTLCVHFIICVDSGAVPSAS